MASQWAEGALLATPLFFGLAAHGLCIRFRLLRGLARPIDRGAVLNGRRLFGDNKTWRGVACVALGTGLGFVLVDPAAVALPGTQRLLRTALLGVAVGGAAMLAELPNSLLKRRLGIAPGAQAAGLRGFAFHVLDQVDVLLGAWLVLGSVVAPTPERLLGSAACVYLGHQLLTRVGHRLGMRASPR